MRTSTLLLLALTACLPDETGFDRTVVSGTIVIPPAAVDDGRINDSVAEAQALGTDDSTSLTWRTVVVTGSLDAWPAGLADPDGDADSYAFKPVADGTWTFTLAFATTPTSGDDTAAPADADVVSLQLVDPATYDEDAGTGIITEVTSSGGLAELTVDVVKNTDYVLRVLPQSSATEAELPYTLVVPGSTPDDTTILVGAYPGADPTVAENPLGGTNATGWTYDAATYTWSADWKMMWFRSVEAAPEDTDPDDLFQPSPTVKEGAEEAFVRAGSLTTLNAGPAAGALYTTTSLELAVNNTTYTFEEPLVLDGVAPKIIGQQVTETLPDTTLAEIDLADYTLVTDTLVAQDIGMLTGLGYVDIVTGSSLMDPAASGWNGTNDSDAFAFTVPESMGVRMVATWDDSAADIDFGIWYADPDYGVIDLFSSFGDTYCLTGSNPEVCESVVTLEPEVTYYLVALGYLGTDDEPYTVELEWMSP